MENDTTIPSVLTPDDALLPRERQRSAHPILKILLLAVLLLAAFVLFKRSGL